ncbi:MAG: hypothetical protein JXX29_00075 [Deltaproteobacteria bacterium]|nr:hypothetical protein [Deltaproteobacteria bacterium]MBN2670032.1 hypothetical protein [Deltaproteobacteria bacterium]
MTVLISFFILLAATADSLVTDDAGATSPSVGVETFDNSVPRKHIRPTLKISHQLDGGPWKVSDAAYPLKGQPVRLRVQNKNVSDIRWYLVFADITRIYQNANRPRETDAYGWRGVDPIQYHRIEIAAARNQTEVNPIPHIETLVPSIAEWMKAQGAPAWAVKFYQSTVGSFWFQVEGNIDGVSCRSYGLDDVTERGISTRAFRLSVRASDDYLGWVSSFYNVPGVFGSILYQSKNYLGADCADVLMSAWSKWKRTKLNKNYNVQMLLGKFQRRAETVVDNGAPATEIRWNDQIAPGDLIAVRYGEKGKKFHHVGALMGDTNQNGILDGDDMIIHAGPYPLHLTPLGQGSFNGHVVVLRP